MKQWIFIFLIAVLFFWTAPSVKAEEKVLGYETAFTLRDNDLDGEADEKDDASNGFWGLITTSTSQVDEFFLEFDISNLEADGSAKFIFSFSNSGPTPLPYELRLAVYEADGIASLSDFGVGDFFSTEIISNIEENVFIVDLTSVFNSFIDRGISHLGIRLYDPMSIVSPNGAAQLKFDKGNLVLFPTTLLEDTMHPTGAVHPRFIRYRTRHNRGISLKVKGYVLDELSIARDGGGIGVSHAFLKINNRKVILKDDSTNLLDENGYFNIKVRPRSTRCRIYRIRLYAADTNPEVSNFGLVDSTIVRVPYYMRWISKEYKLNKSQTK